MYSKFCIGCNVQFETANFRQKRCVKDCSTGRTTQQSHKARAVKNALHDVEFIAVDGEGIDTFEYVLQYDEDGNEMMAQQKAHHYVLLSVGDQTLHKDGKELTHHDIFPFLYEQFEANPDAVFVGYFLGYDFAQWFKTLSDERGWKLLTKDGIASRQPTSEFLHFPWPVNVGEWEFDVLGAKRFKLRRRVKRENYTEKIVTHKDGTQTIEKTHPYKWMFICDTGSFFQSSFMKAIDPVDWEFPIVSDKEYAVLSEGKSKRDVAQFDNDMIRYNLLENAVLPRLLEQVNKGFTADGIRLKKDQWYGPGQAAQAWMRLIGCPTGEEIRDTIPYWARDAARESYYGGWFEIMAHGVIPGKTYAYDINSAYPAGIARLPCLLHGKWAQGRSRPKPLREGSLRLINAAVEGSNFQIGAMPHRRPDGTILRPQKTSGWYWQSEIEAAKRAGLIDKVKISEWVDYHPCDCKPPLRDIAELYEGRLKVGKNSPFGKSKKLVYNSAYGKLAQSIGMPRFSNPIYASLITSHCRAMILDAIATHPDHANGVAMVATDSVTFFSPHPSLDIHKTRLGAWDPTVHENLSLMMPGLYWDDKSRQQVREGKAPRVKSRGVPAKDLAKFIDDIDAQWAKLIHDGIDPDETVWPEIDIPIEFGMVSAKLAASQNRWHDCGKVMHDGVRHLSANAYSKRMDIVGDSTLRPGHWVIRSICYNEIILEDDTVETRTTPYDKAFGENGTATSWQDRDAEVLITPDGTVEDSIRSVLPT